MNFLGSFFELSNPLLDQAGCQKYGNTYVQGEHLYAEDSFSNYVIFAGELYQRPNDSEPGLNHAEYLKKTIENIGIEAIKNLNGQFVAIIKQAYQVLVVRDFLGIGASVFFGNSFFTNSIALLQKSELLYFEPNLTAVRQFLKLGFVPAPLTAFKGLSKLRPSESLEMNSSRKINIHQNLTYEAFSTSAASYHDSFDAAIEAYRQLHEKAIAARIAGKTQIGVLLSGGYDSSGNLAALRQVYQGPITAYSVGFQDSKWNEIPLAKITAKKFDATHEILSMQSDEINRLPALIQHFGEPFFENGLLVNSKIAASISPLTDQVILGGDGNDQFFGTSGREMALHFLSHRLGLSLFQKLAKPILYHFNALYRFAYHNDSILNAYETKSYGFADQQLNQLLNVDLSHQNKSQTNAISKIKGFDARYYWRNFNSDWMESASQIIIYKAAQTAHLNHLNITFPFADADLLQFTATLPRLYKHSGGVLAMAKGKAKSKYLFKQYLKDVLPQEIIHQKKQGGFAPLGIFLNQANTRNEIYQYINQTTEQISFINRQAMRQILISIEKSITTPNQWFWQVQKQHAQIMQLLVLAIWWQRFFIKNEKLFQTSNSK
jgi:asparagine synthase (glutamine-hydrolysing)